MPEQGAADPDMGGPHRDRNFEITAHPHRELLHASVATKRGKMREIRAWWIVFRRYAHKSNHLDPVLLPAPCDEINRFCRGYSALLWLSTNVHLHEYRQVPASAAHFLPKNEGQFIAVEGVNHIEQRHRLASLVGLERSDQMQLYATIGRPQFGPFFLGFLDAVLAEDSLSGIEERPDRGNVEGLGHGNELNVLWWWAKAALRPADLAPDEL